MSLPLRAVFVSIAVALAPTEADQQTGNEAYHSKDDFQISEKRNSSTAPFHGELSFDILGEKPTFIYISLYG